MHATRRDFLTTAVTVAGATVASHDVAQAEQHLHQEVLRCDQRFGSPLLSV